MLDARDLNNLAGKYVAGYGTGFDLAELAGVSPLLDVHNVTFVRIIDVVGSIDPAHGRYDAHGHLVNDPYATPFGSSGFDLTGVGVIHFATQAVPEPSSLALGGLGLLFATAVVRCRRFVA
nr:PEP-CTERM sorting domain-containing protein [Paludisphaera mucosa]